MQIEIPDHVAREFAYIVELHGRYGAPCTASSVDDLVRYILSSIADGSRRPGSWERSLLLALGLVAECDEHNQYRTEYGREDQQ